MLTFLSIGVPSYSKYFSILEIKSNNLFETNLTLYSGGLKCGLSFTLVKYLENISSPFSIIGACSTPTSLASSSITSSIDLPLLWVVSKNLSLEKIYLNISNIEGSPSLLTQTIFSTLYNCRPYCNVPPYNQFN